MKDQVSSATDVVMFIKERNLSIVKNVTFALAINEACKYTSQQFMRGKRKLTSVTFVKQTFHLKVILKDICFQFMNVKKQKNNVVNIWCHIYV